MTDPNPDIDKQIVRQDAVYFLVIQLVSTVIQMQGEPLRDARRLATGMADALREGFFFDYDSAIAQVMHEAIMNEIIDIIRRGLPRNLQQQFLQAPFQR